MKPLTIYDINPRQKKEFMRDNYKKARNILDNNRYNLDKASNVKSRTGKGSTKCK